MLLRSWSSLFLVAIFSIMGCGTRLPHNVLLKTSAYQSPDYSNADCWAALPFRKDSADLTPDTIFIDRQSESSVDVFFLHPTSYTGSKGQHYWNASLDDQKVNDKTDRTSIRHQASIFNSAGKIYAPRYRQAHIQAYFTTKEKEQAQEAFDIAYRDIAAAFQYYLDHYNEGRPIILACHSQGTSHGMRLLKEFFEGKPLQDQLVVAYLVGMPVAKNYFNQIPICQSPEETGCFCSWRTYREGYLPKQFPTSDSIAVVNPLSWKTKSDKEQKENNKGAVLLKFNQGIWPRLTSAQIHQGILWANKPRFPGSFLLRTKNYHAGDLNLYWVNVRENASLRASRFFEKIDRPASPH
ncbi:MAG: DUF3089 domain-containing protein [Saprospiraceae bacterium]|nr:DUF3089 domain-containing protein [Saprospiraceae bacterium]